eukprot:CAMPEP_0185846954 /NCGR_PEP_ID=MMETSP1354-20130828/2406_1 /TAXON_ID=708628 /ORGANISM="Erythrolobus madagascarensis, Strain CCMP3276" /LENGTH=166 /DNA_ID=CAMNT_0028547185 /DNA_START=214 /DNA_END=714 /DNA_ORIENTATION=-
MISTGDKEPVKSPRAESKAFVDDAHPILNRKSSTVVFSEKGESTQGSGQQQRVVEMSVQGFSDRVLVMLSQRGAVPGMVVSARREELRDGGSTFVVDALLGCEGGGRGGDGAAVSWVETVARALVAEMHSCGCRKELVLCSDVSRHSRSHGMAKAIVKHLAELRAW